MSKYEHEDLEESFTFISRLHLYSHTMAYRTDNRHSLRFRMRKVLRRVRCSVDTAIAGLFEDRSRAMV